MFFHLDENTTGQLDRATPGWGHLVWRRLTRHNRLRLHLSSSNWKYHIANISSKLSERTAVIHITSHVLDTKTITLIHSAIILPYLIYCVEVWDDTNETILYSLFIKQKKAIRIVCHAKYLDNTSSLFHKLRLFMSPDIVHLSTCISMYKAFHNLLPPSIQIYFSWSISKKYYLNFYDHFAWTQRKKFSI